MTDGSYVNSRQVAPGEPGADGRATGGSGVEPPYSFKELTPADAALIASWRYDGAHALYNLNGDVGELLDGTYWGVWTGAGDEGGAELVGFFCLGLSAVVPAGFSCGAYDDEATYRVAPLLDVGLGMRPDLTGRGLGAGFLQAGLDFAARRFAPAGFRLTVATFNQRAIAVYERAGFGPAVIFTSCPPSGKTVEFQTMWRSI